MPKDILLSSFCQYGIYTLDSTATKIKSGRLRFLPFTMKVSHFHPAKRFTIQIHFAGNSQHATTITYQLCGFLPRVSQRQIQDL